MANIEYLYIVFYSFKKLLANIISYGENELLQPPS